MGNTSKGLNTSPDSMGDSRMLTTGASGPCNPSFFLFVQPQKYLRVAGHSKHNDKIAEDRNVISFIGVLGVFQEFCFLVITLVTAHFC